jgi:peptidyl-prolyl cis-trans isomerase C
MKTLRFSYVVLLCTAICGAVLLTGCGSKTEPADANKPQGSTKGGDSKAPQTPAGGDLQAAKDVYVTVNGVEITEAQLQDHMQPYLDKLAASKKPVPPQFMEQYKRQLKFQALDMAIVDVLFAEQVKKANLTVTEDEVTAYITEMASNQKPPMTLDQFKEMIVKLGQPYEDVRQQIKKGLLYRKLNEVQWAGKTDVNDTEAKAYFEQNINRYSTPEQVRASHILIAPDFTDPNVDPNVAKAKARAKAQELLGQIKQGADFAELAKANSSCPSKERGGDLNYFPRGVMVEAFEKAAFELPVGQITDVVETEFGYHIIKVADHKPAVTPTFEDSKQAVIKELKQEKQGAVAQKFVESLKANAKIVYAPGKEPIPTQSAAPQQ